MRIPEFIVSALMDAVGQSSFLAMRDSGENFEPTEKSIKEQYKLLIALASRIDAIIEDAAYELENEDRDILSTEKIMHAVPAVRKYLKEAFPKDVLEEFMDPDTAKVEHKHVLDFLDETEAAFKRIQKTEIIISAWQDFLNGEDPVIKDYQYSFEGEIGKTTCSFCGKKQSEVKKLIAGPNIYICDECVAICNDVLAEDSAK